MYTVVRFPVLLPIAQAVCSTLVGRPPTLCVRSKKVRRPRVERRDHRTTLSLPLGRLFRPALGRSCATALGCLPHPLLPLAPRRLVACRTRCCPLAATDTS